MKFFIFLLRVLFTFYNGFFVWTADCERDLKSFVQGQNDEAKVLWSWIEKCVKCFWDKWEE